MADCSPAVAPALQLSVRACDVEGELGLDGASGARFRVPLPAPEV